MGCHNGAANTFTHVECVFDFAQVQLLAMYLDLIVTSSHVAYAPVGVEHPQIARAIHARCGTGGATPPRRPAGQADERSGSPLFVFQIAPGDTGTFYDDFTRDPYRGHLADIVLGGDPDGAANRLPDARGKGATQDDATDGGHHSCLALAPSVEKARAIRPNADGLGVDGLTPRHKCFQGRHTFRRKHTNNRWGQNGKVDPGIVDEAFQVAVARKLQDPRARPPADALAEGLEDGGQVAVLNYHALRLAGAAAGE
ncbi:hypothetical protein PG990_013614 [Apiospora arundinis]